MCAILEDRISRWDIESRRLGSGFDPLRFTAALSGRTKETTRYASPPTALPSLGSGHCENIFA